MCRLPQTAEMQATYDVYVMSDTSLPHPVRLLAVMGTRSNRHDATCKSTSAQSDDLAYLLCALVVHGNTNNQYLHVSLFFFTAWSKEAVSWLLLSW